MPELPEVETTLRGITPHIDGKKIEKVIIRQFKLRWPIHPNLAQILAERKVFACNRRAKYLIITFETGILLIHLGMSGSLRIFTADDERIATPDKHDHLDFVFDDGTVLRYHDPRKFGAVLWYEGIAEHHPLLEKLGPEPLSDDFDANYLYQKLKNQKRAVKLALMDNAVVVGVGNIYANESLFKAGISPLRPANKLTKKNAHYWWKPLKRFCKGRLKRAAVRCETSLIAMEKVATFSRNIRSMAVTMSLVSNVAG